MNNYIDLDIESVSPVSNNIYKFNNENKYVLVISHTSYNNNIMIYKHIFDQLNVITPEKKTYLVDKSIRITKNIFNDNIIYQVKLFEINTNNIINLLYTGELDTQNLVVNKQSHIFLETPAYVVDKPRYSKYETDMNFLDEQFYTNLENLSINNNSAACFLFFKLVNTPTHIINTKLIKPIIIDYNLYQDIFVYDRYSNSLMRELTPFVRYADNTTEQHNNNYVNFIKTFCTNNSNYLNFVKLYQINSKMYITPKDTNKMNYYEMINRKIHPHLRKLNNSSTISSGLTSPADSRMRVFHISPKLQITAYNTMYTLDTLIDNPKDVINGSGFLSRISPQDYNRVSMPFEADLKSINYDANKITLKFENEYFIPNDVPERDLLAILYGNYLHTSSGGRNYPEMMQKQPKNLKLLFYIVIISLNRDVRFEITNSKLLNINNNKRDLLFNQGEELGLVNCGSSYVLFLSNRLINFSGDIKYYSKIDRLNNKKPIDSYIHMNDNIGEIM